MVWVEVKINRRMEQSWFIVPIKAEQLNDNLFLNTCEVRSNRRLHKCMTWREDDLIQSEDCMKKSSRVNTRDIRPREAKVSTDYSEEKMLNRWDFNSSRKTQLGRSEIQESEVGEGEVECCAERRRWEGRLFPKTGAERMNEIFDDFRPEVTEGRLSVIWDEERVERWDVSERRKRR